MATAFTLPEQAKIVQAMNLATDAAGRAGAYVTCKGAFKAYVVFQITQGNAATILLSINQATAVAGTAAKAIVGNARWWVNADCAATDTLVRQADGVSFTTDAGVKNKIVVAEIDLSSLDVAGGFDCIAGVTGASNVANLTGATYWLTPLRYGAATPPSAVVD